MIRRNLRSLHGLRGKLSNFSDSTWSSVLERDTEQSLAHVNCVFTCNNIGLWLSFTSFVDHF